jgi:hypothetical protein
LDVVQTAMSTPTTARDRSANETRATTKEKTATCKTARHYKIDEHVHVYVFDVLTSFDEALVVVVVVVVVVAAAAALLPRIAGSRCKTRGRCLRACVRRCVRACVRASVRVRACVCVCVRARGARARARCSHPSARRRTTQPATHKTKRGFLRSAAREQANERHNTHSRRFCEAKFVVLVRQLVQLLGELFIFDFQLVQSGVSHFFFQLFFCFDSSTRKIRKRFD